MNITLLIVFLSLLAVPEEPLVWKTGDGELPCFQEGEKVFQSQLDVLALPQDVFPHDNDLECYLQCLQIARNQNLLPDLWYLVANMMTPKTLYNATRPDNIYPTIEYILLYGDKAAGAVLNLAELLANDGNLQSLSTFSYILYNTYGTQRTLQGIEQRWSPDKEDTYLSLLRDVFLRASEYERKYPKHKFEHSRIYSHIGFPKIFRDHVPVAPYGQADIRAAARKLWPDAKEVKLHKISDLQKKADQLQDHPETIRTLRETKTKASLPSLPNEDAEETPSQTFALLVLGSLIALLLLAVILGLVMHDKPRKTE